MASDLGLRCLLPFKGFPGKNGLSTTIIVNFKCPIFYNFTTNSLIRLKIIFFQLLQLYDHNVCCQPWLHKDDIWKAQGLFLWNKQFFKKKHLSFAIQYIISKFLQYLQILASKICSSWLLYLFLKLLRTCLQCWHKTCKHNVSATKQSLNWPLFCIPKR